MNKHRRDSRRILNTARGARHIRLQKLLGTGYEYISEKYEYVTAQIMETDIRRATTTVLCMAIAAALLMWSLAIPPGPPQEHISLVCSHTCDDGCHMTPNEHERMLSEGATPLYLARYDDTVPGFSQLNEEAIAGNDAASVSPVYDGDVVEINTHAPSASGEQGILSDDQDRSPVFEGVGYDETNDADDSGPAEVIDLTDASRLGDEAVSYEPGMPYSEWQSDTQMPEGFTLTIVVEGFEGMAVVSQSGYILQTNPLKSPGTYVINGVQEGEMFIFVASPDDDGHFAHWEAYLTDDDSLPVPISSFTEEPPVSGCSFIMPDADVTLVLVFTTEEQEPLEQEPLESPEPRQRRS